MKSDIPIPMIVDYPDTKEGMQTLNKKAAAIHADAVSQYIQKLNCPASQKIELLNQMIADMILRQNAT